MQSAVVVYIRSAVENSNLCRRYLIKALQCCALNEFLSIFAVVAPAYKVRCVHMFMHAGKSQFTYRPNLSYSL